MKYKIPKYMKVLKIELEDLEEDLLVMAEIYHQREQKDEITDYVFLENLSLLQSEIAGIDTMLSSLNEIDIEKFTTLAELVEFVDQNFRKKTDAANFPESVYALVKRKLTKVSKYIQDESD